MFAAFLWPPLLPAAIVFQGDPPVHRFPVEADVYPQNFDVVQAPDGVVHVGNSEGLLSFDGRRWKHAVMPDLGLVRSLAHDGGQRLYAGGFDHFGYFSPNAAGELVYTNLADTVRDRLDGERFADIWEVRITPAGVAFLALEHLFLYRPDDGTIRMWRHPGRFGAMLWHRDRLLLQYRDQGLKALVDGEFRMIPGGDDLAEQIFQFLPLPDGGLLTLGRDGRWLEYADGRVTERAMPAGLPGSATFSAAMTLPDGQLVLGSDEGHLFFLDPTAGTFRKFRVSTSLLGALAPALDGGILVQTDLETIHLAWPSEWSLITAESGLSGDVFAMKRWRDRMLALTSNSVLATHGDNRDGITRFEDTGWTSFEAWDFLPVDDELGMLAESYAVLAITPDGARPLSHNRLYPRRLRRSEHDPGIIYVGTESGLAVLRNTGEGWRLELEPERLMARVLDIEEMAPRRLLLGTDTGGIIRVALGPNYDRVESWQPVDADTGIEYGPVRQAILSRLDDGRLIAATARGLFRADPDDRFESVQLDGLEALRRPDQVLTLRSGPDGSLWAWSYNRLYHRPPGGDWRERDISGFRPGALSSLAFDDQGQALFGAAGRIMIHSGDRDPQTSYQPSILLRGVAFRDGMDEPVSLPPTPGTGHEIRSTDFSMIFEYALPDLDGQDAVAYQARLLGYETEFSDWGAVTRITFSDLKPGEYAFQARARDSSGRISSLDPYRFRVLPRWYQTGWARTGGLAGLAVVVLVLAWLLMRWRLHRINSERARLAAMVDARTAELAAANRRLEDLAHQDGLTGLANRRRLDAFLAGVWSDCADSDQPLSVVLMDVDRFKRYNDRNGHLAGDRILKRLAGLLQSVPWRNRDLVARYGGEEFMAVLPGADTAAAARLAEDVRYRVAESDLGITLSAGTATTRPRSCTSIRDLIHEADRSLYEAKNTGRNRVGTARHGS